MPGRSMALSQSCPATVCYDPAETASRTPLWTRQLRSNGRWTTSASTYAGVCASLWFAVLSHVAIVADCRYGGDPSRGFLVGHSAGGHSVTCLATSPTLLRDAGVDRAALCGVVTIGAARIAQTTAGEAGGCISKVLCCCCACSAGGANSEARRAEMLRIRPYVDLLRLQDTHGDTAEVPHMLLLHGSHEYSPAGRAHAAFGALAQRVGVRCTSAELPGDAHLSCIMRVGLSDDSVTPMVLSWVRHRAEHCDRLG